MQLKRLELWRVGPLYRARQISPKKVSYKDESEDFRLLEAVSKFQDVQLSHPQVSCSVIKG